MRWSKYLIPTLKEDPKDAELISHKLMLRAGLIRRLTSGVYSYLPLGLRVLKKIEDIIRDEMDSHGAHELLLPALQPAELWHESGRYKLLEEIMVKHTDRNKHELVLGPTHEEVITDIVRNEVKTYKALPLILYQIQTKFRDEARPRGGIIRSREFIMKDAYSFDRDDKCLNESYDKMYEAYSNIFKRCGLNAIAVEADTGAMGGDVSHEFVILSEAGEDSVIICDKCSYAANLAKAECIRTTHDARRTTNLELLGEVNTPGTTTIEKVSKLLKIDPKNMIKTLIYKSGEKPVAVLVRGDCDVNEIKLARALNDSGVMLADEKFIERVTGAPVGFSGPVGLKNTKIIADYSIEGLVDFVSGANKQGKHFINVNLDRDFTVELWADLRYAQDKDLCPKCKAPLKLARAIELGHVFKLGTKYSAAMNAKYLAEDGKEHVMVMGCYGIGVNRIAAAAIEQGNDKDGIVWPLSIAPYQVIIIIVNEAEKNSVSYAETLYSGLNAAGISALLDDREERAGIKFKDADLIGIPIQVVVGERDLAKGMVEIKFRKGNKKSSVKKEDVISEISRILAE